MKKKCDILLVYTWNNTFSPHVPYSAVSVAAAVDGKYRVSIFDTSFDSLHGYDLKSIKIVGISTISGIYIKYALDVIRKIKSANPHVVCVWGGQHASVLPEQTLNSSYCDIVVRGEGEGTFQELSGLIMENDDYSAIKGISYKRDNRIIHNHTREHLVLDDIEVSKFIPYINASRYPMLKSNFYYEGSRGCPYRCAFCTFDPEGKFREKSASKMVSDIEYLKSQYGFTQLSFLEPVFFVDMKKKEEFVNLLLEKQLNISWAACCRIEHFLGFSDRFIKKLKESGCARLNFGAESGSDKILNYIDKKIIRQDILNVAKVCRSTGLGMQMTFMCGFPIETMQDIEETMEVIWQVRESGVVVSAWSVLVPHPGAQLYSECQKYGFVPPKNLEEWGSDNLYISKDLWYAPWLDKKRKTFLKFYTDIVRIFYYRDYTETLKQRNVLNLKSVSLKWLLSYCFFYVLNIVCRRRWQTKCMSFPVDIWLYRLLRAIFLKQM